MRYVWASLPAHSGHATLWMANASTATAATSTRSCFRAAGGTRPSRPVGSAVGGAVVFRVRTSAATPMPTNVAARAFLPPSRVVCAGDGPRGHRWRLLRLRYRRSRGRAEPLGDALRAGGLAPEPSLLLEPGPDPQRLPLPALVHDRVAQPRELPALPGRVRRLRPGRDARPLRDRPLRNPDHRTPLRAPLPYGGGTRPARAPRPPRPLRQADGRRGVRGGRGGVRRHAAQAPPGAAPADRRRGRPPGPARLAGLAVALRRDGRTRQRTNRDRGQGRELNLLGANPDGAARVVPGPGPEARADGGHPGQRAAGARRPRHHRDGRPVLLAVSLPAEAAPHPHARPPHAARRLGGEQRARPRS